MNTVGNKSFQNDVLPSHDSLSLGENKNKQLITLYISTVEQPPQIYLESKY